MVLKLTSFSNNDANDWFPQNYLSHSTHSMTHTQHPSSSSSLFKKSSTPKHSKIKKARVLTFIRGSEFRNVNISIYPKRGLLLQHLRQAFGDDRLSYFVEPQSGDELESFQDLKKSISTVLVLDDSDDVEYVLYRYNKDCQGRF